jgi:RNA polymerase sigma-70 factor, ECF subfamily
MGVKVMDREDADLASRFRDGDPDAVRELYRRYAGALLAISRSMLGDPELARDAVQQTFIQAWRAASTFDPERKLSSWLYQICRRVCIDRYRQERRPSAALTATGELVDVSLAGPSMERIWAVYEVRRAIDELPEPERVVMRLSHLDGQSYSEIADRLGVPLGTVKSRAFRAHERLTISLAHLRDAATGMETN